MPRVSITPGDPEKKLRVYRTEGEHDRDMHIIAEMYLKGHSLNDIYERVLNNYKDDTQRNQITLRTIENDLLIVRKRWVTDATVDFDELRAKELARLDGLEKAYWDGWESSRQKKSTIESETADDMVAFSPTQAPIPIKRTKDKTKNESRDGDPRFLEGITRCIEMRCKILGLFSPERIQSDWRILSMQAGLTEEDQKKMFEDTVKSLMTSLAQKGAAKPKDELGEIVEAEFEMAEEE